jgi:hypothetical protein
MEHKTLIVNPAQLLEKTASLPEGIVSGIAGAGTGGALGAGAGGLYGLLSGALSSRKNRRIRDTLVGALRGAAGGGLLGAGAGGGLGLGAGLMMPNVLTANPVQQAANAVNMSINPLGMAAGITGGGILGAAGGTYAANKARKNLLGDDKKEKDEEEESTEEESHAKAAANSPLPVTPTQPTRVGPPTPADFQRFWGDRIMRTGIGAFGAAAGATGLYQLARRLSSALRQEDDEETDVPSEPAEKTSGTYDDVATNIGRALPDSVVSLLSPFTPTVKRPNTFDPNVLRSSFGTGATLGAGALGAYGGYKLVKMLNDRYKKKERESAVEDAEKEYYAALLGRSNDGPLDNVYDKAAALAAEKNASIGETLSSVWDATKRVPSALGGAYIATGLGVGGLAAKLMYDRARERSRAKAVEEAAKSRARIAGILPTYVDPDEIEALRHQATVPQGG